MDDNRIEIVARLDTSRSAVVKIEADLSQVADQVNKDRAFKIIGNLDLPKTTQRIQSQLATINKDLNLNIGKINVDSNVENVVSEIQNNLSNVKTGVKANIQIDSTPIEEFGEALGNLDIKGEAIDKLKNELESLEIIVTKIIPKFQQLKGEDTQKLTSLAIQGIDKFGNNVNLTGAVKDGDIEKLTTTVTQNLAKIEQANKKVEDSTKAVQTAYNDFLKLQGTADVYSKKYGDNEELQTQFENIRKLMEEFDNTQPVEKQRETIIKLDNALKSIKIDIDAINQAKKATVSSTPNDYYPNIAKIVSSDKSSKSEQLDVAKTTLNDFFNSEGINDSANRVKRAVEDVSGELQRFYVQVEKEDKSVETLTYALNEQGNAYEYLGKTIREADNSTDFRRKDITTQWNIQSENLKKFIANAEKAGLASTDLKDDIEKLQNKLAEKGDTSAMNSFLDDLDIAKAKYQALNAEARKDSFATTTSNKIQKLSADMAAFAQANERAVTSTKMMSTGITFADKWKQLISEMAKGADLSADEVKHLREELGIFGKEAEAAGLKGKNAWGKFLDSFKVMSSYLSANMVFNMVKRQLRDMANEVIAVDTAMTELRKVTEATNADFEKFAKSAAQTGKELGASISDVINATSTFSRAGYGLPDAEELGRIATLYKNVGDGIDIDTASESIISVMKAFNIEAENSITIIDKINEVSNRAAIDSGGLGLALQRVASAMDAANNSLDETIALTTSANEVVQNPEMVAQGWRTVALRIRGAKTELEDAGLETEGMVESTAKLRDLIKGISGVDIMLDEKNFKSTYQIIDEIGKVWKDISDVDQASLLEAIAGKRQSNIVAATLNNYERLEEILEISQDSAGSAMREQEEYAKSIQYSIDRLKATYQELAQTVMKSDFLKNLIELGAEFLEILTKIIDKVGALPTLFASIMAVQGFLGKGIFNIIAVEAGAASLQVTIFGKSLRQIIGEFGGLTASEIAATVATKGFAIALKLASAAVNTLIGIGIGFAIQAFISGINKFINAEKEAAEKMQEQQEVMKQNVESFQREQTSLEDLYEQYVKLASTTSNLTSEKEKLLDIQKQINEVIGEQAEGIDLLNGSLEENIKITQEQRREEARKILEETQGNYDAYKEGLESSRIAMVTKGDSEVEKAYIKISQATGMKVSGTLEEQSSLLQKMLEAYKKIEDYNVNDYNALKKGKQVIDADIELFKSTIQAHDQAQATYDELTPTDKLTAFNNLLAKAIETQAKIEEAPTSVDKFVYSQDLSDIEGDLYAIAGSNSELQKQIEDTFNSFSKELSSSADSLGDWKSAWLNTLDEVHKAALSNVDSMKSALQKIAEGEGLTSDEFWGLAEFDTEGILNSVQLIGDKFIVTDEQIIALKDAYIQKQIDSIKLRQQELLMGQKQAEGDAIAYQNLIREYDSIRYGAANYNNPDYRRYVEEQKRVQEGLDQAKAKIKQCGEEWQYNDILLRQYNASLGNTIDRQKQLNATVEKLTDEAESLLKAYETRIDDIIDDFEKEKKVLEANRDALQDQLELLEEQKDNLESIVDDYKTVADVVSEAIQKQIDALKEQNEEREEAIDLAEKLANLENAKNNKVRVYTEAGGWTYEAKKADVQKAEEDLRKSEVDAQIKKLEAYQKKWQNIPNKAQQSAEESLADQKLGADWREKIADQDEDIFEMYETEYDKYCRELYRVSNVEMESARKAVDAANKEVAAKDKEIQKWQEYKSKVTTAADEAKKSVEGFYKSAYDISLSMGSDDGDMARNLDAFYEKYLGIIQELTRAQDELNESVDGMDFSSYDGRLDDLELRINKLEANWQGIREDIVRATREANHYATSEYEGRQYMKSGASGTVVDYTGLLAVHGTKQKSETIFNANDSAKLYDLVHNTPNLVASMLTDGTRIAQGLQKNVAASGNITFNGTTINLPNVQNPEQFARQMEAYMQTVLSESQVYKPRR